MHLFPSKSAKSHCTKLGEEREGEFIGHDTAFSHFPKHPKGFEGGIIGGIASDENVSIK